MRLFAGFMLAVALFVAPSAPAQAQETLGMLSAENVANISGTRWQGDLRWSDGDVYAATLYFRPDGVLEYGYNGTSYDNGRWLQNDALIHFQTNRYYAVMVGTLSGGTISGSMHSRNGAEGVFSLTQQGAAAAK